MTSYRFDPVDLDQMRLLGRLSPAQRVQLMLEARELAVGLIRGRLRRQYPDLPIEAINLKLLEEVSGATMDSQAAQMGEDVWEVWQAVKQAARREADRRTL
jgi:hypothetical protein